MKLQDYKITAAGIDFSMQIQGFYCLLFEGGSFFLWFGLKKCRLGEGGEGGA